MGNTDEERPRVEARGADRIRVSRAEAQREPALQIPARGSWTGWWDGFLLCLSRPFAKNVLYTYLFIWLPWALVAAFEIEFPVLCLVSQSCLTLCNPMDCSPPGSSVHGDSPGKNTAVGCHSLPQGIFPTQGLNTHLLHSRQILYH